MLRPVGICSLKYFLPPSLTLINSYLRKIHAVWNQRSFVCTRRSQSIAPNRPRSRLYIKMSTGAASTESRPTILVVSLHHKEDQFVQYTSLFSSLSARFHVIQAQKWRTVTNYLSNNNPAAAIVTDGGIVESTSFPALASLQDYVLNGGTIIFGCAFSRSVAPHRMNGIWETFKLPWKFCGYHSTEVYYNTNAGKNLKSASRLATTFSLNAMFLEVNDDAALYKATSESLTQSQSINSESTHSFQSPVAWQKVGTGWLGYIGSVNREDESDEVMLAMCGFEN
ncbi:hypothetical protein M501DRAFT_722463 [Patellaria atrata CBS 101060]|uniref:Uncharacterized protein n=1 Tax=Patellaria atrata CBS 101060 TaxID=1346257 RepID=A0A9P4SD72_9PEZI|nr:hypothetical protein M501DRAFT_722463 [Patellaria atrata CBS 101060]